MPSLVECQVTQHVMQALKRLQCHVSVYKPWLHHPTFELHHCAFEGNCAEAGPSLTRISCGMTCVARHGA